MHACLHGTACAVGPPPPAHPIMRHHAPGSTHDVMCARRMLCWDGPVRSSSHARAPRPRRMARSAGSCMHHAPCSSILTCCMRGGVVWCAGAGAGGAGAAQGGWLHGLSRPSRLANKQARTCSWQVPAGAPQAREIVATNTPVTPNCDCSAISVRALCLATLLNIRCVLGRCVDGMDVHALMRWCAAWRMVHARAAQCTWPAWQ